MKQKIHTVHSEVTRDLKRDASYRQHDRTHKTCHPELIEGSHFQIPKLINFQILLFCILYSLFSISVNAQQTQPYQWQWAMKGGSSLGDRDLVGEETIYDVKVGSDGNYYFIAPIFGSGQSFNAQLDGIPVYPNNAIGPLGTSEDIFLFSTTCDGQVRWSQAIGGGMNDNAYNLVLDSNDNVYIGGYFNGSVTNPAGTYPVRFSPTDSLPSTGEDNIASDYWKRIFLVKYDKDGNYKGKKALQGDVSADPNGSHYGSQILDLAISNDTLHFVVGLLSGTHLDDQVTVPAQYTYDPNKWTYNLQYHLVKYDTDLNYISNMVLPVADGTGFSNGTTRFAYDKSKKQYYIAGMRGNIAGSTLPLSYEKNAFVERSFILAINDHDGSEVWRKEIYSQPSAGGNLSPNYIFSLAVDKDSDIYVGGTFFRHPNENNVKIYDPTDSSVQPYFFTPGADKTVPMIIKFNSDGDVQWVQATAAYAGSGKGVALRYGKGLAINNDEVVLGAQGGGDFWDNIEIVRPVKNYQPDPILVRFDKQSGKVLGVHDIAGEAISSKRMTAVAVDNDGNYIAGGSFDANLFWDNDLGLNPLISTGKTDFFVAKLANSECGSGNMGTDEFNKLSFNVYPNPTTGIINVETTDTLLGYTIYDMSGKQIVQSLFAGNNQINLENASNGVYFIVITTVEGNSGTVKVVKK